MREKGKIVEKRGEVVVVEIEKENRKECSSCGLCKMGKKPYIEIESEKNFNVGDSVIVEVSEDIILKSSLLIYGLPLAGFVAGVLLAGLFRNHTMKVIIFFLIFGGTWYIGLNLANKLHRRYKPQIKLFPSEGNR